MFVTMLIEPNPHICQSLNKIASVRNPHFCHPHGFVPKFWCRRAFLTCCCVVGSIRH